MNEIKRKEKIEMLVGDAKELLNIFEDLKEKADINNKSLILKHIDRTTIAKNIIPYLGLEDIINFRTSCKDLNAAVSSTIALVSYSKTIKNKKIEASNQIPQLGNLKDTNEIDDIEIELESVKRVIK